ncbi:MAG: hypothetical protein ACXADU_04515 [Promethearchaeota archaeon]|jgi:hypothetical protein
MEKSNKNNLENRNLSVIVLGLGLDGGVMILTWFGMVIWLCLAAAGYIKGVIILIWPGIPFFGTCIHILIFGLISIFGALLGWKERKVGFLFNLGTGLAVFIVMLIQGINVFVFYFRPQDRAFVYTLGAIFNIVAGIVGYKKLLKFSKS